MKSILRWISRRPKLSLLLAAIAWLLITPIIIVTRTYFIVHSGDSPSAYPLAAPEVEEQTEGFTCGVHALHTLYRAYGLDPSEERVRWRLGVDTKAVCWLGDSTGALHPDLFMVLGQDHFAVEELDPIRAESWDQILDHLAERHLAVFLIKRRENGNLHWVTVGAGSQKEIQVYDSLHPEPYLEGEDFLREHVISALLVQPELDRKRGLTASFRDHWDGFQELRAASARIK
ncbi:MAG: hypothetical protein H7A53_01290 [Akkermansiaceae bacterium]|nr:hypothetical protein [Akkermansiaceae bacterium]MCP5549520.1 hypothetical protein [Akkermansiaceae bacterium]